MPKLDSLGRPNAGFAHLDRAAEHECYISFMATKAFRQKLTAIASAKGISKGALIRTYLEWMIDYEFPHMRDHP